MFKSFHSSQNEQLSLKSNHNTLNLDTIMLQFVASIQEKDLLKDFY